MPTSSVVWVGDQAFCDYRLLECYKAGMYGKESREAVIDQAAELLGCDTSFSASLDDVTEAWPVACCVMLTDPFRNRQAWLGRAGCCFKFGACVAETNAAWFRLSVERRAAANVVADRFIKRVTDKWKFDNYHRRSGQSVFLY